MRGPNCLRIVSTAPKICASTASNAIMTRSGARCLWTSIRRPCGFSESFWRRFCEGFWCRQRSSLSILASFCLHPGRLLDLDSQTMREQSSVAKRLVHGDMQFKTEVTNSLWTSFWSPDYLQQLSKIHSRGVQRGSNIDSGGFLGAQA